MTRMPFLLLLPALAFAASAQPFPADSLAPGSFRVYTHDGAPASLEAIVVAAADAEVLFLGEVHDDSVTHVLQHDLLVRAVTRLAGTRPVALSMEMFEQDVQVVLDEYAAGLITEDHFLRSSRPWAGYAAHYRPMVEFARAHGLAILAANPPRRYANRVSRLGPEALADLPPEARAWLPPLPYPGPSDAYRARWNALMQDMAAAHPAPQDTTAAPATAADTAAASPPPMHGMGHMLDAQALWDAGMAYTLAQHLMRAPGSLVVHLAGAFHVERGLGTPEQLRGYRPGTRMLVVAMRPAADVTAFDADEHAGLGDFIVLTAAAR
ncbi:hypothetical protein AWN76_013505 [Rhodothermaceae bacterium RA]|nr:hypothetical protein AWN76_013505 [Rhodothermaceae bacterium RA]